MPKTDPLNLDPNAAATTEPAAPAADPLKDVLEKIDGLSTSMEERFSEFDTKIEAVKIPEPETTTEPKNDGWQPKTWDEFPELAKQTAQDIVKQELEARDAAAKQTQDAAAAQQKEIETNFQKSVDSLVTANRIPAVKNPEDPNDPGRQALAEIYGLGVKYHSTNIEAMADLADNFHKSGVKYDPKSQQLIRTAQAPAGAMSPVGSANGTVPQGGSPDYKYIHSKSMDQIIKEQMGD